MYDWTSSSILLSVSLLVVGKSYEVAVPYGLHLSVLVLWLDILVHCGLSERPSLFLPDPVHDSCDVRKFWIVHATKVCHVFYFGMIDVVSYVF